MMGDGGGGGGQAYHDAIAAMNSGITVKRECFDPTY